MEITSHANRTEVAESNAWCQMSMHTMPRNVYERKRIKNKETWYSAGSTCHALLACLFVIFQEKQTHETINNKYIHRKPSTYSDCVNNPYTHFPLSWNQIIFYDLKNIFISNCIAKNSRSTLLLCDVPETERNLTVAHHCENGFWRLVKNCMFWPYFVYRSDGARFSHARRTDFSRSICKQIISCSVFGVIYLYALHIFNRQFFATQNSPLAKPFLLCGTPDLRVEKKQKHKAKLLNVWALSSSSEQLSVSITIHHHF